MTQDEALQLLELKLPFSKSELKQAYREALMVWHPDRFAGNEKLHSKAHKRTCLINEAFEMLSNLLEEITRYQSPAQPKRTAEPANPHRQTTPTQSQQERSSAEGSSHPLRGNKAAFIARFVNYWSTKGYDFTRSPKSQIDTAIFELGAYSHHRIIVLDGDEQTDQDIVSNLRRLRRLVKQSNDGEWTQDRVLIIFSKHTRAEEFLNSSSAECVHVQFWRKIKTKGWIGDLDAGMIRAPKTPMSSIDIGDNLAISKMNKILFNQA
jgi:hypothetical protein